MMTDDALRRAYEDHSRDALPEGHPEAEALWRLAAGELTAEASREVIDHLSLCPSCAEDFRVTRRLVAEAEGGSAVEPQAEETRQAEVVPIRRASRGWLQGLAVAAVLGALAVGLSWRTRPPEEVPFRQGRTEIVRSLVAADVAVPRRDARLRWAGPEGARYDLLVTVDLRVIAAAGGLEDTEYLIPESQLDDLPAGTVLRWHVEAVLPDGGRIPSETFDLRLADE